MKKLLILTIFACVIYAQIEDCPTGAKVKCGTSKDYVCGVAVGKEGNQTRKTFDNKCLACEAKSHFIVLGKCEKYNKSGATFCHPGQKDVTNICGRNFKDVCGWYNPAVNCISPPCNENGSNPCAVCKSPDVVQWTNGKCPKK